MKCPSCGTETTSKFCPECGSSLAARTCAACGAKLSARAKFCPDCGTAVPGAPVSSHVSPGRSSSAIPWAVAGFSLLAMIVTIIVVVARRPGPAAPDMGNAGNSSATGRPAPDISNLTPREQADRLFDRVMEASTAGDTARISFFGPMALNAYTNIAPLDPDARLHVGMINMVLGNAAAAFAQVDSIARQAPGHLFAPLLEARTSEATGATARGRDAFRRLLASYDSEMAKNLAEYQSHRTDLQAARATAQGQR